MFHLVQGSLNLSELACSKWTRPHLAGRLDERAFLSSCFERLGVKPGGFGPVPVKVTFGSQGNEPIHGSGEAGLRTRLSSIVGYQPCSIFFDGGCPGYLLYR